MVPLLAGFNTENGHLIALPESFRENWVILVLDELCKSQALLSESNKIKQVAITVCVRDRINVEE